MHEVYYDMAFLFNLLFFLIPLVFFPLTSELFEFNKTITVYVFTILISAAWIIKMISARKIIFRRTSLDLPLLIFLTSLAISTLLSIDFRTSLLGYYSRFHGGLVSYISYSLLYWAYVSNLDRKHSLKLFAIAFISTLVASVYAVLEHFGASPSCLFITGRFDVACWVQDVSLRPFATFGQPNWLAAWLVALLPVTWGYTISKNKKVAPWIFHALGLLFFITLLFTKSRSGILGFGVAFAIFWGITLLIHKKQFLKIFMLTTGYLLLATIVIGTPWSTTMRQAPTINKVEGPALEVGGTESGEIRKIVWKGAIDIWKNYPVFGSGLETFAFSYYQFRPIEHNLVSEWNFLYNRAHNEYLNFATTTGTVGIAAYVFLIATAIWSFINSKNPLKMALLAGYTSILVTNFFGFSVAPIALLFFLYPAMANAPATSKKQNPKWEWNWKIIPVLLVAFYLLLAVGKYWHADFLYAEGKKQNKAENYAAAVDVLRQAVDKSPSEAVIRLELAKSYSELALEESTPSAKLALEELTIAKALSPRNVMLLKLRGNIYSNLTIVDPNLLLETIKNLNELSDLAPTDPTVFYSLAIANARLGELDTSIEHLQKAVSMKPNYKRARYLLGLFYLDEEEPQSAKEQFEYILKYIAPEDKEVLEQLEKLQGP